MLWPPHVKSWLTGKDLDAGRDWGQEEKGTTEDEMAGWLSLTRWTWVWINSGSWWWTGRPGVLRVMGSQRVGHYWETELQPKLNSTIVLPSVMGKAPHNYLILTDYFLTLLYILQEIPFSNVNKFGKFSSGHRAGKGWFSFQCQRKAMPKKVQTTMQLYSFHMLAR